MVKVIKEENVKDQNCTFVIFLSDKKCDYYGFICTSKNLVIRSKFKLVKF